LRIRLPGLLRWSVFVRIRLIEEQRDPFRERIGFLTYRFGEFTADLDAYSLTHSGIPVHLRRKSFQVLAILLQHHSRLVGKEEILAAVWPNVAVTDDVLVGVIRELRKSLGDNPENPAYIKTMRGTGYRFIAPILPPTDSAEPPEEAAVSAEAALPEGALPEGLMPPPRAGRVRTFRLATLLICGVGGWVLLMSMGMLPGMKPKPVHPFAEVAWWRFDEAAGEKVVDATGNGNDGTIRGGARRARRRSGGAIELDGVRGWVSGAPATLPRTGEPLTFTAWIRVDATSNDFTSVFQYGHGGANTSHGLRSTLVTSIRPDGRWEAAAEGVRIPIVGGPVSDGRWHQIAVCYEGPKTNTAGVFTDGEPQARGRWSEA
jgi:DNA-binding winged helix-turn-helix (wHTH) protein